MNTIATNLNKTLEENILGDINKLPSNDFGEINMALEDNLTKKKKRNLTVVEDLINNADKQNTFFSSQKNIQELKEKNEEKIMKLDFDGKKDEIQSLILKKNNKNLIQNNNDTKNNIKPFKDKNLNFIDDNLINIINKNEKEKDYLNDKNKFISKDSNNINNKIINEKNNKIKWDKENNNYNKKTMKVIIIEILN